MLTACTLWVLALSDGRGYLSLPDSLESGEPARIVHHAEDATRVPDRAYFYDTEHTWPASDAEPVCVEREVTR